MHRGIGVLDQPRQQADEHGAGLRLGELLGQHRDRGGRGHFAQVHAAHSVGNHKQIAVRAGLLARGGDKRAHGIFVVGANFAEVACLAELYIQHVRRRMRHLASRIRAEMLFVQKIVKIVARKMTTGWLSRLQPLVTRPKRDSTQQLQLRLTCRYVTVATLPSSRTALPLALEERRK